MVTRFGLPPEKLSIPVRNNIQKRLGNFPAKIEKYFRKTKCYLFKNSHFETRSWGRGIVSSGGLRAFFFACNSVAGQDRRTDLLSSRRRRRHRVFPSFLPHSGKSSLAHEILLVFSDRRTINPFQVNFWPYRPFRRRARGVGRARRLAKPPSSRRQPSSSRRRSRCQSRRRRHARDQRTGRRATSSQLIDIVM